MQGCFVGVLLQLVEQELLGVASGAGTTDSQGPSLYQANIRGVGGDSAFQHRLGLFLRLGLSDQADQIEPSVHQGGFELGR